jgi:hypothetical protein
MLEARGTSYHRSYKQLVIEARTTGNAEEVYVTKNFEILTVGLIFFVRLNKQA